MREIPVAQLLDRVLAHRPRNAVFDCDGTLWAPDAGSLFLRWSLRNNLVSEERRRWIEDRYRLYEAGQVSQSQICGEMTQLYAGLAEKDLRAAALEFFSAHIAPQIFRGMQRLVTGLAAQGVAIWAVSSTNTWVIEEGARAFGIPAQRVLGTRVLCEHGVLGDQLLHVPTGEEKVAALRRAGVPQIHAAFGNSIHDAAMLEAAAHPYVVNPTPELLSLAAERAWPIVTDLH